MLDFDQYVAMCIKACGDKSYVTCMTSCHMCLGLCCGFVVVSMETEHNFEHNSGIIKGKRSIAGTA